MKKVFVTLLVLALTMSFQNIVYAEEKADKQLFVDKEYGYTYSEVKVQDNKSVVRSYENASAVALSEKIDMLSRTLKYDVNVADEDKYRRIKSVLVDLGMDNFFVDELTKDNLEMYCASNKIGVVSSYTKTDLDGSGVSASIGFASAKRLVKDVRTLEFDDDLLYVPD